MAAIQHIFSDPEALAAAFVADFFASLPQQGKVCIALSGGSTPKLLFQHWASHFPDHPDWQRIHFFWGDERCVPPDHADSNFRMTQELLLDPLGISPMQVHRIRGEAEPGGEARRYAAEIAAHVPLVNGWPVFDLIMLGMGDDGHTASIFPDQLALLTSEEICAVATHPQSGQQRVSLTGKVLNAARQVAFLITGAGKAAVLRDVLNHSGEWRRYPASYVKPAGSLCFYMDAAAS